MAFSSRKKELVEWNIHTTPFHSHVLLITLPCRQVPQRSQYAHKTQRKHGPVHVLDQIKLVFVIEVVMGQHQLTTLFSKYKYFSWVLNGPSLAPTKNHSIYCWNCRSCYLYVYTMISTQDFQNCESHPMTTGPGLPPIKEFSFSL